MLKIYSPGIEDKDERSTYDDFREFEEAYIGKRSPKSFRSLWSEYIHNKNCLLKQMGIFRLDLEATKSPIGSCGKIYTTSKPGKKIKGSERFKKSGNKKKESGNSKKSVAKKNNSKSSKRSKGTKSSKKGTKRKSKS